MTKAVKIAALFLVAITLLCSCARNGNFNGGVLLDSDKLSEIRAEVFTTEDVTSDNVSENDETTAVIQTENDTQEVTVTNVHPTESFEITTEKQAIEEPTTEEPTTETVIDNTEKISETREQESEYNESTEDVTVNNEESAIVYWTKNGKVWHFSQNCRYLKNSAVVSGTANDAMAAGKERACASCGK